MWLARHVFIVLTIATPPGVATARVDATRPDFLNFDYPWPSALRKLNPHSRSVAIRNGTLPERPGATMDGAPGDWGATVAGLAFADVTGDGHEEALVLVNVPMCCHGWGINIVYVYSTLGGRTRLLLCFVDGDRALGGFRDVYSDNGRLVVELWGRDSLIVDGVGRSDERNLPPACCAAVFTRTKYQWNGRTFRVIARQVIDNPNGTSLSAGGRLPRPAP